MGSLVWVPCFVTFLALAQGGYRGFLLVPARAKLEVNLKAMVVHISVFSPKSP